MTIDDQLDMHYDNGRCALITTHTRAWLVTHRESLRADHRGTGVLLARGKRWDFCPAHTVKFVDPADYR